MKYVQSFYVVGNMNKYFDVNIPGHSIKCKLYYGDLKSVKNIIIFGHGFGGHKDNKAAEKFADKAIRNYKECAVLVLDWPSHGSDVKKKLTLLDCDTYITAIIDYIKNTMNVENIYVHATSFGGYLFLKYIHEHSNPFVKLAFRCPAIKMFEVTQKSIITQQEMELLQKGKPVAVGFDRKIKIDKNFLEDIKANDISQYDFSEFTDEILIIHGKKDEIIPYDMAVEFCDDNILELIPIEKADHRFQDPDSMDRAIHEILEFFF